MIGTNRKIRILFFIGSLRLGGAEKQVVELALGLDKSRFDAAICCINKGGDMVEDVRRAGVPVYLADITLFYGKYNPLSWIHLLKNLLRVNRHIRRQKPDIVHGYLFTAYIIGALCGRWAGVPIILASRRSLGYFKDDKPWRQKIENYANKKTDLILVNSKAVWEDVLAREKNCEGKIRLIYNGVDLQKYRVGGGNPAVRSEWHISPDDLVVGVVANLIHYKGHLEILYAAARLKPDFPRLKFVLVGRDGGMLKPIEEKIISLGLKESVVLAGSRGDVDKIIPAFDILLLASHQEGFSNVLLEGMACAKPIVATRVGGNAESVADGETGFIIPPRDPGAMADALRKLLNDAALRARMGAAGRQRMEQLFSREALIRNMENLYLELVEEKIR